jgi:hypothetical protein
MKKIDSQIVKRFAKKASDELPGDWVIIGGSVLPLMGIDHRVTVDIDVAGPDTVKQQHVLKLMKIAEGLGLAPEAVNQAGAFFLHKIKGWEKHLVLIQEGKKGRVFRPNLNLFIRLKIGRLSESDLGDCIKMICHVSGEELLGIDATMQEVKKELAKTAVSSERHNRMEKLLQSMKRKS